MHGITLENYVNLLVRFNFWQWMNRSCKYRKRKLLKKIMLMHFQWHHIRKLRERINWKLLGSSYDKITCILCMNNMLIYSVRIFSCRISRRKILPQCHDWCNVPTNCCTPSRRSHFSSLFSSHSALFTSFSLSSLLRFPVTDAFLNSWENSGNGFSFS